MEKHLSYKEAMQKQKGGAVNMNHDNMQAQGATIIAQKQGLRPEALYNWVIKHKIDLTENGHVLADTKNTRVLASDVLNDTVKIKKEFKSNNMKKQPVKTEKTKEVKVKKVPAKPKRTVIAKGVISPAERKKVLLFVDKKGDLIATTPNRKGGTKGRKM